VEPSAFLTILKSSLLSVPVISTSLDKKS